MSIGCIVSTSLSCNHIAANNVAIPKTTNCQKPPPSKPKFRVAAFFALLSASLCVILRLNKQCHRRHHWTWIRLPPNTRNCQCITYTKPSNSKLDAPSEEAELCPSVVTTTVCSASCRPAAVQPNPHITFWELLKPSITVAVDCWSMLTEYRPDWLDWTVDMYTALPVGIVKKKQKKQVYYSLSDV